MPDQLEYIVKDAIMMCDKGAAPGMFTPTFNTTVKISGLLASTKADKIPMVNIPTFGACACRGGSPCTPVPVEWLDTYKAKVKGQETILYRSKLPCGNGGEIEFLTSGQVPLPDGEMDALMEEFAEPEDSGWGFWDAVELVPVVGSVTGMVREGAKGNWGMVAMNAGFLAKDVAGVVSFGSTTAASTAGKAAAKTAVKAATKGAAKKFAKALSKKVDDIARKMGRKPKGACFPAGTPIAIKDGFKNVEDIQVGDLVWAYNENSGESALKPVVQLIKNEVDTTINITFENEVIESTVEHPFFTRRGWKDAADLSTEDEVKTKSGTWSYVKKIEFNYQKKKVYNFEVRDWHTYFVGTWALLVHNAKVKKCATDATKFRRNMAERRKALLRDARDPKSGLSKKARDYIKKHDGKKVPKKHEVSHEKPLYTRTTPAGKRKLDKAGNMRTQQKSVHRKRHKICGDQYHKYGPANKPKNPKP